MHGARFENPTPVYKRNDRTQNQPGAPPAQNRFVALGPSEVNSQVGATLAVPSNVASGGLENERSSIPKSELDPMRSGPEAGCRLYAGLFFLRTPLP
ncbi:hypothetical protein RISK_001588 [Rhodopirellula islandica]|uniref:Uncharacterized protein n=1 Tax=Rhodopirellula islandica TaxID=595434 RepID=A0A0J1BIM3_RHOIS|nr:hypothetical protein RISK_001588 [Rhodopirellula islandica]